MSKIYRSRLMRITGKRGSQNSVKQINNRLLIHQEFKGAFVIFALTNKKNSYI